MDNAGKHHISMSQEQRNLLLSWLFPLLLLIVWESASRAGLVRPHLVSSPSAVLAATLRLIADGTLFIHLLVSLRRAVIGWFIGASIGCSLGMAVGFSRFARFLLDRTIQMFRAIPFLALLPLVIVWFGVGETQKIFMVALAVSFPIYINTILGIRQLDPKLLELGRIQRLGDKEIVRNIILPGALPSILMGVRYSLASSWLALIISESIGADAGIGFMATDAREFLQTDVIILTVFIYAGIGVTADAAARFLERKLLSWHPAYAKKDF
jgi:sulfonate transport system permease protein